MTIRDIFTTMDYGPAPESSAEALAWIATHNATFGLDRRRFHRARGNL
jgi:aldehyde dehydrogenase (NAD+)